MCAKAIPSVRIENSSMVGLGGKGSSHERHCSHAFSMFDQKDASRDEILVTCGRTQHVGKVKHHTKVKQKLKESLYLRQLGQNTSAEITKHCKGAFGETYGNKQSA